MFHLTIWRVWWGCRGQWGVLSKWASYKIISFYHHLFCFGLYDVVQCSILSKCASNKIGSSLKFSILLLILWFYSLSAPEIKHYKVIQIQQLLMKFLPSAWRSRSEFPGKLTIGSLLTSWRFLLVV